MVELDEKILMSWEDFEEGVSAVFHALLPLQQAGLIKSVAAMTYDSLPLAVTLSHRMVIAYNHYPVPDEPTQAIVAVETMDGALPTAALVKLPEHTEPEIYVWEMKRPVWPWHAFPLEEE